MKILFLHIPKTAGSSFRRFLERSVREAGGTVGLRSADGIWSDSSESYPSYDTFCSEAADAYRESDLVCGHYPFDATRWLPAGTAVVTVLRDPIERVVSHVKHQMALERQTGSRTPEDDVNGFLANPRNEMFLDTIGNLTLKYLSGGLHPDAVVDPAALSLERAVAHACRCHFGFADELGAFQDRLARDLFGGAPTSVDERFENRSQDRFRPQDLTPSNRDRLLELTRHDRTLDEILREVLAARVALDRDAREPAAVALP